MDRTQYLLALVQEECAEISHAASKGLRFGLQDVEPGQKRTNAEKLSAELTDICAVINLLEEHTGYKLLCPTPEGLAAKRTKIEKWADWSRELGRLHDRDPDAPPRA